MTFDFQARSQLQTIGILFPVSDYGMGVIKEHFATVHYYPKGDVPPEIAREVEVWFCQWIGLGEKLRYEDLTKTEVVQLTSAGANLALKNPALQSPEAKERIAVCSASGVHVLSIPGYIIAQIINLYMSVQTSVLVSHNEKRWPKRADIQYRSDQMTPEERNKERDFGSSGFFRLRGRTAGMLGYGHIARETARLLKEMGVEIIAANSSGERKADDGYIIPGTGDEDCSVPKEMYSTTDAESFKTFLSKSDILIASLPSTPQTQFMLKEEHFAALPKDAIFINVGRGDLVSSDVLLNSLNAPDQLLGAGLDVTDPEPLPDGHELLSHPRVIITPHISADIERYFDAGVDVLVANVQRMRAGGKPMNRVDPHKGY